MNAWDVLGFLLVLAAAAGIIIFSSRKMRARYPALFRKIPAITRLRRAIGLSVEDGSRVHVTLGNADLTETSNPSALVGLSSLHSIGQLSSNSDQPPVCTSGNGGIALLSKDVLRAAAVETSTRDYYNPDTGYLSGATPFSFALGALDVMKDNEVKTNVLIGNFGVEAGLLTTRVENQVPFTMAASDSIVAQAVFMATNRDVVIGEELYAIPAYLAFRPAHVASLRVQDYLRLLVSGVLIIAALLKIAGIL
jgi:hypothetical protein